ncbi:hypothetical protein SteCoe_7282 [Stentor coeruleus]|uniref:KHA domain-containing protein n=1 Tax=Stentor coeruleus TaxID=5963 RepID=A0A1R2CMX1_9CILI|nr:hypothetical protein SteCoe_7282 [Stentor coeruleus]
MADPVTMRIVIYKNTKKPSDGKSILISPNWSKAQVLKLCSENLGVKAKKIFNESGHEINSFTKITEGSNLYASQGENFQVIGFSPRPSKNYVLCVLGSAAVGKSAIIQRYVQNKFVRDYDPTIEDYYKKIAIIDGETVPLSIFDTAGMEDYYPLIDEWIDKKDGFILVYSMDIKDSLQKLNIFIDKIKHRYSGHGKSDPVVVIVGNKIDIPNREITTEEGRRFADNCNRKHFEVSAATGAGVDDVFNSIVRELKTRREEKPVNSSTSWWSSCNLL